MRRRRRVAPRQLPGSVTVGAPRGANIFQQPRQPWPGYGIFLGKGLVLTAAHVVGRA